MKIKKLELIGFKSFVDRTIVHFDQDVIGIVGPNGCGKSNIVDAIRWCMGEQSAKHLRGRSMEDVIFSGSESRAAHDMAEVTLTFENDDPTDVPLEYKDYAEIAVTRRLHRSGDSEYLINKTTVRLKDITDLFLGTGVGTKAYSIIEQGKVGLIVSAKPEDRRLLIEEAAGITKFKSKKKQAERKMELTQQNLLRVGDIVAEIERNLGSLKRQAAKAERYLSYRKELEDLQLYEASHKYLEHVAWIKVEQGEVSRLTADADEARAHLVAREAELETVRLEAHTREEALEAASNANFAADNDVRAEEAAIVRGTDKLESLKAREAQAERELEELAARGAVLEDERAKVEAEVSTLLAEESGRADATLTEQEKLVELSARLEEASRKVSDFQGTLGKANAEIAAAEASLSGFERRATEMRTRIERMHEDREHFEGLRQDHAERIALIEQELVELREGKVQTAEEKQALETSLTELRQSIVGSERALEEAKGLQSKARSRLHALEEVHARREGVGAGVKALMKGADPSLLGLVADRIETSHEFTAALAGLLGPRLSDVVSTDIAQGLTLLGQLHEGNKGRATLIPAHPAHVAGRSTTLPTDEGVVARLRDHVRYAQEDEALVSVLVGDAIVVRDVAAALRIRPETTATLVTTDGTVFHADGSISGGSGEEVAEGMLETKREIRELGEEVARLEALVSERLASHQAMRHTLNETQTKLEFARQRAHSGELALLNAEKDVDSHKKQLEQVNRRLEHLAAELSDLTMSLEEASLERANAEQVLEGARATAQEAAACLEEAEGAASTWRDQVETQRTVVTEYKVSLAKAREKLTAAQGTLERLQRSVDELEGRKSRLVDELATGAVAFGETAANIVLHKERLHAALDVARDAQARLSETRAIFEAFRTQMLEAEETIKGARSRAENLKDDLTLHEMSLREHDLGLSHLLEAVREKFRGLELGRVIGDFHLRPPPDEETKGRIQELTSLLDRMGGVNLDAMREHEEAEKRFAFYSEQKNDLEKALADLERAIQQMNRESKRLFQETFDAVNERFQEVFPRMFRGGRAALRLTNPEDMLETGIDILAQPPGKKLSSIELMSGGEKALTAVSLIFAIFQIKPSPFCILDEVDAPLDEANVARYNEMVRSMTDRSQFILITHIKRTMQMVDVLYGVTMQESGVSRLVSVKLNDSAEKRRPAAQEQTAAVA